MKPIHLARPEKDESSHEDEADSFMECVPDSWSTAWTESEDGDEESEVEAALCTPPLPRLEVKQEVDSWRFPTIQSCEEHLHLDLEVHEYELIDDHSDTPRYPHRRTDCQSNLFVFNGSPNIPHAIVGLSPVETFELIKTSSNNHRPLALPPDVVYALDDEGDIKLTPKSASSAALLSNHMHPRWRHYRFSAHSVAEDEVGYEGKVPVTYLDEGMVEMERLREMSTAGRLHVRWGGVDRNRLSWM